MHNLYLTKEYCPYWKREHALKELITRTISKQGSVDLKKSERDQSTYLVLSMPKPLLSVQDALYGNNPFDSLDEGFKIAILVFLREGSTRFRMDNDSIMFIFELIQADWLEEETLHVRTMALHYGEYGPGTSIRISNVSQEELDYIYALQETDFMKADKARGASKEIKERLEKIIEEERKYFRTNFSSIEILLKWLSLGIEEMKNKGKDQIKEFIEEYAQEHQINLKKYDGNKEVLKEINQAYSWCEKLYSSFFN